MASSSGTNLKPVIDNSDNEHVLTRSELQQAISDATAAIIAEVNANEVKIDGLSGSGGTVDSSATMINNHTTTKTDEIKAEIVRQTAGSLYDLIASDASLNKQAVLDALAATGTGSLRQYITDAVAGIDTSNLDVAVSSRATPADIAAEVTRTTGGSLYAKLQTVINAARDAVKSEVWTRATPADVTSARDSIKGGWSIDGARVDLTNSMNSVRDNVKAHVTSALENMAVYPRTMNNRMGVNHALGGVGYWIQAADIANTAWSTLTNISNSSGVLTSVIGYSCQCIEIMIDGVVVLDTTSGAIDVGNRVCFVGYAQDNADFIPMPPLVYKDSLRIRYKLMAGSTINWSDLWVTRVKNTGG